MKGGQSGHGTFEPVSTDKHNVRLSHKSMLSRRNLLSAFNPIGLTYIESSVCADNLESHIICHCFHGLDFHACNIR